MFFVWGENPKLRPSFSRNRLKPAFLWGKDCSPPAYNPPQHCISRHRTCLLTKRVVRYRQIECWRGCATQDGRPFYIGFTVLPRKNTRHYYFAAPTRPLTSRQNYSIIQTTGASLLFRRLHLVNNASKDIHAIYNSAIKLELFTGQTQWLGRICVCDQIEKTMCIR